MNREIKFKFKRKDVTVTDNGRFILITSPTGSQNAFPDFDTAISSYTHPDMKKALSKVKLKLNAAPPLPR